MNLSREALLAEAVSVEKAKPPYGDEWWRGALIYEVYWRSFKDSDGDGIGDIAGLYSKLQYIADLGVDGIWIAPFYPSPQEDFGYDVTDARSVDPRAGTTSGFLDLLSEAHRLNLKVLLDFIPIHTSHLHPWFLDSRVSRDHERADWYIWADSAADGGPPNNWLSSFGGGAWTWEPRRSQYYYHPFLPCQPALKLSNEQVLNAVLDDMRFWLGHGVDGFRLDAVQCLACDPDLRSNPPAGQENATVLLGGGPNNPFRKQLHVFDRDVPAAFPLLERMRETVEEFGPDRILLGELADVDSAHEAQKYSVKGKRLHATYDFDLINCRSEDIPEVLRVREHHLRTGWVYNVFTNHDSKRAVSGRTPEASSRDEQIRAAKMLLFLQFTLKGGGILFQGDELGLTQPTLNREDLRDPWGINLWPDFEGRDGVRTPIPWAHDEEQLGFSEATPWLNPALEHAEFAVDLQEVDQDSVLNFVRAFLKWRRRQHILRNGGQQMRAEASPLIAFDRSMHSRTLRCVVNFSKQGRLYPLSDEFEMTQAPGCIAERNSQGVNLPGYGFAICKRTAERR